MRETRERDYGYSKSVWERRKLSENVDTTRVRQGVYYKYKYMIEVW